MQPTTSFKSKVAGAAMMFAAAAGAAAFPVATASPAYADSARVQQLQQQIDATRKERTQLTAEEKASKARTKGHEARGAAAAARGATIDEQMGCYVAAKTECKGRVPVGIQADGMNSCEIRDRVLKDRSLCPTPTTSAGVAAPG